MTISNDNNDKIDRETVRVRKGDLAKLLTCSICNNIFNDPVNITECLHIFCKRCILKKISEEYLNRCPVCNVFLGCMPQNKLRPDHNWSSIRATIAPSLGQAVKEDVEPECAEIELVGREDEQSTPFPARRKDKYLSSLVNKRNVSGPSSFSRREKARGKMVLTSRGSATPTENPHKSAEKSSESSRFSMNINNSAQYNKQSSKQQIPTKGSQRTERSDRRIELVYNLLKPLTETENFRNYDKTVLEGDLSSKAMNISKREAKSSGKKLASYDADVATRSSPPSAPVLRPIRKNRGRPKKTDEPQGSNICAQTIVDTASSQHAKRVAPVWLSLVSSANQEGVEPLPQIPRCYLMIKNVTLPVSFIKKYIVQKLGLDSEDEVEISLWGSPLPSAMKLHGIVDLWSQTISKSEKLPAVVGASAEDFVMVLSYGRKLLHRRN